MYLKNRIIALIYRSFACVCGVLAILFDLGVFNHEFKTANLMYFTILSNLFCVILFFILSIKTYNDLKKYGINGTSTINSMFKGEMMISIILTMTVYHFILIPYTLKFNPYASLRWFDIVLHYIMPIFTVFDWIIFDEKGRLKLYDPILWIIGPYMYLCFVFLQSKYDLMIRIESKMNKYIYSFLDVDVLGTAEVVNNIFSLTIIFVVIGYFIVWIDKIEI